MSKASPTRTTNRRATPDVPYFVVHASFEQTGAADLFGSTQNDDYQFQATFMPDEVTRDLARRMHYAAWRLSRIADAKRRAYWKSQYLSFRDRIVLGNRKLIYRAVRRWMPAAAWADDMTGDCQIVLIQAVAAYNPWLGIRFSTYAFTCLMRALSRLSQRHTADRLSNSIPLDALPDGEPRDAGSVEEAASHVPYVDEFFREKHDLLSSREKEVLSRRFSLDVRTKSGTLEQVGRELGLSKERVRQVQASALSKLRKALLDGAGRS